MRLHALQYLRAAAALVVVYSHAVIQRESYLALLPEFGGFGVDVFFVISGFIMVWIAKPGDTPRRFFVNRVRRVVPLYWFFTLLMALIMIALPAVFKRSAFDGSAFVASLAFIPRESLTEPGKIWPILAPGWSLNYEMYFYLLFALSLLLAPRWRTSGTIGLLLAVVAIARLSGSDSAVALFYGLDIVFEFAFGMLLAVAYRRGFRLPSAIGAALVLGGATLLLVAALAPQADAFVRSIRYGVPALMVVTGCLYVDVPERRWAVLLGDASYSLYLSHLFTLGVLRVVLPPLLGEGALAAWLFVAISLVVCTLVSLPVHLLIDNWLLRHERLGRFAPRIAPGPTTPPTAPSSASKPGRASGRA